jgi:hypothetical protein
MKLFKFCLAAAAALLICAPAAYAAGQRDEAGAAAYCVEKGGAVQARLPAYNTNGGTPLILSGHADFCQFTSQDDGSQINILLATLSTKKPTLAALAYYAEVPLGSGCNGNPASCYCTQLGGTDLFGGINAAGGGWVKRSDATDVLETCIFPDLSSIDSWGLAYHSAGIIRGTDLSKILRYPNPYNAANAHAPAKPGLKQ